VPGGAAIADGPFQLIVYGDVALAIFLYGMDYGRRSCIAHYGVCHVERCVVSLRFEKIRKRKKLA
jgi:hypothetical protein